MHRRLIEADKERNSTTETEKNGYVVKVVGNPREEMDRKYAEARRKLSRQGVSPQELTNQVVSDKWLAERDFECTEQGQLPATSPYHKTRGHLVELCRLRNVPNTGTRDELKAYVPCSKHGG